jgi:hypothetical protein
MPLEMAYVRVVPIFPLACACCNSHPRVAFAFPEAWLQIAKYTWRDEHVFAEISETL